MKCPICKSENIVVYGGKHTNKGNYRRYRRCIDCQHAFTTMEYHVMREGKVNLFYYNDHHGLLRVKEDINNG